MSTYNIVDRDAEHHWVRLLAVDGSGNPISGFPQVLLAMDDLLALTGGLSAGLVLKFRELPVCISGGQKYCIVLRSAYYDTSIGDPNT